MYFLEKVGEGVEGMNMLKQKHTNKFMFQPFMQWLTENLAFSKIVSQNKAPIHSKILLWIYISLRLCSGKIIKAPEKCKQQWPVCLKVEDCAGGKRKHSVKVAPFMISSFLLAWQRPSCVSSTYLEQVPAVTCSTGKLMLPPAIPASICNITSNHLD